MPIKRKSIALVAHDTRKKDLIEWVEFNREELIRHDLVCTGTTGRLVKEALGEQARVRSLKSGPLGGDQQMGALIADDCIDVLIFLWEPMQPQPHEVDVKALQRLAVVYNVPMACNLSTADFLISSPLFSQDYDPKPMDYQAYLDRKLE